jgi:hypothetical protein
MIRVLARRSVRRLTHVQISWLTREVLSRDRRVSALRWIAWGSWLGRGGVSLVSLRRRGIVTRNLRLMAGSLNRIAARNLEPLAGSLRGVSTRNLHLMASILRLMAGVIRRIADALNLEPLA